MLLALGVREGVRVRDGDVRVQVHDAAEHVWQGEREAEQVALAVLEGDREAAAVALLVGVLLRVRLPDRLHTGVGVRVLDWDGVAVAEAVVRVNVSDRVEESVAVVLALKVAVEVVVQDRVREREGDPGRLGVAEAVRDVVPVAEGRVHVPERLKEKLRDVGVRLGVCVREAAGVAVGDAVGEGVQLRLEDEVPEPVVVWLGVADREGDGLLLCVGEADPVVGVGVCDGVGERPGVVV